MHLLLFELLQKKKLHFFLMFFVTLEMTKIYNAKDLYYYKKNFLKISKNYNFGAKNNFIIHLEQ